MPKISFSLSEQISDIRSNEKAYELTIHNLGGSAIELRAITPRIPDEVELIEVKDPSIIAIKGKHNKICSELSILLNDHLQVAFKEFGEKKMAIEKELIETTFGHITGWPAVFRFYFQAFKPWLLKNIREKTERRLQSLDVQIEDSIQAKKLHEKFFSKEGADNTVKSIFAAKLEQLSEIEEKMGHDIESSSIATIEPDSFYAETYVLKFPRSKVNPRKFNISIEGSYSEQGQPKTYVGSASTSIIISPRPFILSVIAVIASLLGVCLKVAVSAIPANASPHFYSNLLQALTGRLGVSAVILALLFFNIYEFTGIDKKVKMGVGWRSALLIGILCGLLNERMLDALKTFVGF